MRQASEAHFEQQIEQLAAFYGWLVYHPPDNRPTTSRRGKRYVQRVTAGFPDLTLVRAPELIFAELKTDTGRVAPAQRQWLEALGELERSVAAVVNTVERVAEAAGLPPAATEQHRRVAVEAHVWRPRDFELIHARLARGRTRHEPLGAV